ncbi:hypothetical protein [Endozoicomonas sp.]|uniref:hypothetical protein n=1 Tax=Endozoicomonas sp. TaxID=1892382 RepID=UPI00383A1058
MIESNNTFPGSPAPKQTLPPSIDIFNFFTKKLLLTPFKACRIDENNLTYLTDDNNCSICRKTIDINARNITIAHCGHVFHEPCIKQWSETLSSKITNNTSTNSKASYQFSLTCPNCRQYISCNKTTAIPVWDGLSYIFKINSYELNHPCPYSGKHSVKFNIDGSEVTIALGFKGTPSLCARIDTMNTYDKQSPDSSCQLNITHDNGVYCLNSEFDDDDDKATNSLYTLTIWGNMFSCYLNSSQSSFSLIVDADHGPRIALIPSVPLCKILNYVADLDVSDETITDNLERELCTALKSKANNLKETFKEFSEEKDLNISSITCSLISSFTNPITGHAKYTEPLLSQEPQEQICPRVSCKNSISAQKREAEQTVSLPQTEKSKAVGSGRKEQVACERLLSIPPRLHQWCDTTKLTMMVTDENNTETYAMYDNATFKNRRRSGIFKDYYVMDDVSEDPEFKEFEAGWSAAKEKMNTGVGSLYLRIKETR